MNKLKSWLEANKLNPNRSLIYYALFSHLGRAILMVYYCSHKKNRFLKIIVAKLLRSHYHIEIGCNSIGSFFMLPHPRNIIISAESIGDYVQVNQNVTIGGNMRKTVIRNNEIQRLPIIGNHVVIYTNSVVGGPCRIGNHVIIGSNSTCTMMWKIIHYFIIKLVFRQER